MKAAFETNKKGAAEFFGVSTQALDGWFNAGCPIATRDRLGHIASLDLGAMTRWRLARDGDENGDGHGLDRERTRLTKAQADKTELEVAELRAELVRVPLVETHWQAMIAAMRARLVGLPSKIAPQVAGPDDLTRVQDMIQAGVYEALAEIAGDAFPDDVRRRIILAADGRNDGSEAAAETDSDAMGKRAPSAKRGRQRRAGSVPER